MYVRRMDRAHLHLERNEKPMSGISSKWKIYQWNMVLSYYVCFLHFYTRDICVIKIYIYIYIYIYKFFIIILWFLVEIQILIILIY